MIKILDIKIKLETINRMRFAKLGEENIICKINCLCQQNAHAHV